jgi:hypothetical protein
MDKPADKMTTPSSPLLRRLANIKFSGNTHSASAEQALQLRQSLNIVNQLLNENAHRPDATRLLRKILQERAETHKIKTRDENSLSG